MTPKQKTARVLTGGLFLVIAVILSACSGPGYRLDKRVTDLPATTELTATPFFPQERYQCGPAALATVLRQSRVEIEPDRLVDAVYIPQRKGSLQPEMIAATRRFDRIAYVLQPDLSTLLTEVSNGKPVLVLLNLGIKLIPKWHYAVVVGYDLQRERIILRSGTVKRKVYSLRLFDRLWRRSGRWAIVIVAASELPATAREQPYLRSVLALEQSGKWRVANRAYTTAGRRWPDSLGAAMGLGNSYYHLQKKQLAEQAYRKALGLDPHHAPALNNLAQVLMEQNRLTEARSYAGKAVDLGGDRLTVYQSTLGEIEKRLEKQSSRTIRR